MSQKRREDRLTVINCAIGSGAKLLSIHAAVPGDLYGYKFGSVYVRGEKGEKYICRPPGRLWGPTKEAQELKKEMFLYIQNTKTTIWQEVNKD